MYEDDDLILVSAVGQFVFCERRCALMFVEQIWEENVFTAEGTQIHERVHKIETESRRDIRIGYGLLLRDSQHGLVGKADVVEFHRDVSAAGNVVLPDVEGVWRIFPVEHKHGTLREEESYKAQLCAQAFCLEDMLRDVEGNPCTVPRGAIYYDKPRRRLEVTFDEELRARTCVAIEGVRELLQSRVTPAAEYTPKCRSCSLFDVCIPKTLGRRKSVQQYLDTVFDRATSDEELPL